MIPRVYTEVKRQVPISVLGNTAECHVGPIVIVGPQPVGGKFLNFLKYLEQVTGKLIVTHGPVVSLDVGVLLRLSRLDEIDADAGGLIALVVVASRRLGLTWKDQFLCYVVASLAMTAIAGPDRFAL